MIVQPDFFEHWKTKQLTAQLKTEAAPLFVLRLWAHCQSRRKWRFENLSDSGLAGVTGYRGNPSHLRDALKEAKFIIMDGDATIVHDFENVNASLIASWNNGAKGGKKPTGYPRHTRGPTHREPGSSYLRDKSTEEDKIRRAGLPTGIPTGSGSNGVRLTGEALEKAQKDVAEKLKEAAAQMRAGTFVPPEVPGV